MKEKKKENGQPEKKIAQPNKWDDFFYRFHYAIIALLAFLVYANTLTFEYALDDRLLITQNGFTKKGIDGVKDILTHDAFTGFFGTTKSLVAGGRYRPLTQVMFAVEYQFFGLNPFVGHLINVLLFMGISLLLYDLLRRLPLPFRHSPWLGSLAFIATVLFVVHPIHTEVVANIKGRDELMSLFGSLGALWFVMRYLECKKSVQLLWAFFSLSIALFSKENSVTFAVIIPLALWFFYKPSWRDYVSVTAPLVLATGFFIVVRTWVLGGVMNTDIAPEILNDPFIYVSKSTAIATLIYTWGKYLLLLLFPHPLTHDYYPCQIPYFQFSNPLIIFLSVAFVSIVVIALWGARQKKLWSFSILFALISFSIQSNLVFNLGTFMNERFVFVSSIGVALLGGLLVLKLFEKKRYRMMVSIFFVLMVGLYGGKTIARNFAWKNDQTLFLTDVKTSSNSIKCNVSAGGMALEMAVAEKDQVKKMELIGRSLGYLSKAQKLHPGSYYAWFLMGNAYLELKEWGNSLPCYRQALLINSTSSEVRQNVLFVAQQAWKESQYVISVDAYRLLTESEPANEEYQLMMADALSHVKRADTALTMINAILAENPKNASAWCKKGEIYGRVYNDLNQAELNLKKSLEIDPRSLSAIENLGIVYGIKQDFENSLRYFNLALEIDSTQPRIYRNIAGTYSSMGDYKKAEHYLNLAKKHENR